MIGLNCKKKNNNKKKSNEHHSNVGFKTIKYAVPQFFSALDWNLLLNNIKPLLSAFDKIFQNINFTTVSYYHNCDHNSRARDQIQ